MPSYKGFWIANPAQQKSVERYFKLIHKCWSRSMQSLDAIKFLNQRCSFIYSLPFGDRVKKVFSILFLRFLLSFNFD